jgi:hypothetical protein
MHIQSNDPHVTSPRMRYSSEAGGQHDTYGFALTAHPGKSQRRPDNNTSSQLIRYFGLPTPRAPDASVLVRPGYSRRAASPSTPVAPPEVMPDNNIVEQDHRNVKRLTRPGLGFGSFWTARRTLAGYGAMAMMRKGQVRNISGSDIRAQATFIVGLFQVSA